VAKTALLLDGRSLTLADAGRVLAGERFAVRLSPAAARRVAASNALVARAVRSGDALYGINTGFGKLARVRIDDANLELLQHNLIVSHAAGVGEPLDPDVARLALLLRANTLATGHSGVRRDVIDRLATLFQRGVAPWIPAQGSVGASGDLAPLAHLALLLIGRGRAWLDGQLLSGAELATKLRLKPLVLGPKEGLALINGTQISTAIAVAGLIGAKRLAKTAPTSRSRCRSKLCAGARSRSTRASTHCAPIPVRSRRRRTCASSFAGRSPAVARATATRCRTRTRCAARRKSTAPCATH
jgi:histidine ammonia-lyase